MKDINEIYKEWCGEDMHVNDCHPVHDSTETIEFAEYYAEQLKILNIPCVRDSLPHWSIQIIALILYAGFIAFIFHAMQQWANSI